MVKYKQFLFNNFSGDHLMKSKKLFWMILFIIISLILLCVWIIQNNKHKTLYEPIPIPIKKTMLEAQQDINKLLIHNSIKFLNNGYILENNKTINSIVSILNQTVGDIAIKVASYTNNSKTASYNRKLTQKRADNVASYIKSRYNTKFITAIGYGKEFPLSKEDNRTDNRIEIHLRRINNDF